MNQQLQQLKSDGRISYGRTVIYDQTDGCTNQYRQTAVVWILSILSQTYGVTIDRYIHAPGHGKGIVDGLNATTKRYLMQCMQNVDMDPSDDKEKKQFKPWMNDNSFAQNAVDLCTDPDRKDGVVTGGNKNSNEP